MKILCENNKEVRVALAQLEKQGYKWLSGHKPTRLYQGYDRMIIVVDEGEKLWVAFCNNSEDAVRASILYANLLR